MGAKTWMLVWAEHDAPLALLASPVLDREATQRLASRLFPDETLTLAGEGDLSFTCPPDDEVLIGCFDGVSVIAAKECALDHPSRLPSRFIGPGTVTLHAMHSVVDWLAFAQWRDGQLRRSLSLSPDSGVLENIGTPFEFELPFWAGQHTPLDPIEIEAGETYPFPFHPLELGEAALVAFFGYQLEGFMGSAAPSLEPEAIPLLAFRRGKPERKAWWRVW
ncbi:MAG: hypothetical protein DI597_16640 [Pseudoxanthomonas spadix]|nr:MAG: hypothetical protein DI597_16640 [Pseudoxanthomonas spadix]